jgi:hypothetical protein
VVEVLVSWSVVAAIAGIVAVIVTILYGEVQRRIDRKQLRLAQEEAELRPKLVISFKTAVPHPRPPDPGTEHPHSAIVFNITNDGRSAAHNVHCEVHLDERRLVPDEMYGANHDIFEDSRSTSDPRTPSRTRSTSLSLPTARPKLATDSCATRLGSPKAPSSSRFPSGRTH